MILKLRVPVPKFYKSHIVDIENLLGIDNLDEYVNNSSF